MHSMYSYQKESVGRGILKAHLGEILEVGLQDVLHVFRIDSVVAFRAAMHTSCYRVVLLEIF